MNPKYEHATRLNFSDAELQQANANFAYGAKRFPDEHAKVAQAIQDKGLAGHREVQAWYLKNRQPIPLSTLATIEMFADSSYAGPFGVGAAHEAPSTANASAIYRPEVKPGGAE